MSILKKSMRRSCQFGFHRIINEDIKNHESSIGRELTKDEAIKYLFGDWENTPDTELDLYLFQPTEEKPIHRINRLWAFPLTFVLAPFRYVLYGDIGWTNKTMFGRFLLRSCGYSKD